MKGHGIQRGTVLGGAQYCEGHSIGKGTVL